MQMQTKKPAVIVLAPAKKKVARVMLVPKGKEHKLAVRKTFKAKHVRVTIDNTAKTMKRRKQVLSDVDGLSEAALRDAAVNAKLSRRETVAKVPTDLLRQMMKDYRMMRGMLV